VETIAGVSTEVSEVVAEEAAVMLDFIDEMYRDLARDIRSAGRYEQYPSESIDYKIMMQDLSGGSAGSIVPDIEFTDASIVQLRSILHTMPRGYLKTFYFYYIERSSKAKKISALGVKCWRDVRELRDRLHSYTLYRLDNDSVVDLKALTKDRLSVPIENSPKKVAVAC
jgi:hypothetical protein